METLLNWINNGELDKLQEYISSLNDINSILIYDEDTNLNLLHIISANDSLFRDDALNCLLDEDKKNKAKPKLDINLKSGPGNDCFTACHLAACYGNLSTLELLLENGANPTILDRNGFDAIDIATAFDQFRCVDLIRRKLKSNKFSKDDLNKSCDTIFYSFKDSTLNSFKSIKKIDQQLQTSGQEDDQFNNTFGSFNTIDSKLTEDNSDQTLRNNSKLIFSASKVLDKNYKELNDSRKLNDTFTYDLPSLNKVAILNSRKKNIKSTSCSKVKNNKSVNKSINNRSIELTKSTHNTNIIRNLRQNFEQYSINNNQYSIDDESIDPFDDKISIRSLSKNKEIYTDNEFNVSFLNETKDGLLSSTRNDELDKNDSEFLINFNSINLSDKDENDGCLNSTLKNSSSINNEYYNNLDNNQLYNELMKYDYRPGPITISTRDVYIKKLIELNNLNNNKFKNENKILNNRANIENNKSDNSCLMFSKALRSLMKGDFDFKLARHLENEFINSFENDKSLIIQKSRIPIKSNTPIKSNQLITPTKTKTSSKQFFNYLLLDPRITQNLSKKASDNREFHYQSNITSINNLNDQFALKLFKLFIFSIFYIGKGQGNRPYSHLYDAAKFDENQKQTNNKKKSNIKKLNKIKEIWDSNCGVISLHCFHNISSMESLTRECFMIDAIGISFLTNIQIGQNRIKDLKWTQYKRDVLGTYLLFKAFNILLVNGEREIKRADFND